jgi:hypothetical protein
MWKPTVTLAELLILSTALPIWIYLVATAGPNFPGDMMAIALCLVSCVIESFFPRHWHYKVAVSMLLAGAMVMAAIRIVAWLS